MRKIQIELLIIGSIPTAVIIFFGLAISLTDGQPRYTGAIVFFTLLSICSAILLAFRLRKLLFNPLEQTITGLLQGMHAAGGTDNLTELSLAIDAYISNSEKEHECKLQTLTDDKQSLDAKHETLELLNAEIIQSDKLLKHKAASQKHNDDTLLRLCYKPLKTIVGFTNRINQKDLEDSDYCIKEINRAARILQFLIRETQDSTPIPAVVEIEPWQITGDILEMLSPIMSLQKNTVSVKVSRSCPTKLSMEGERHISLIFQYLLHYFLHRQPGSRDLALEINYSVLQGESELVLAFDEENYPDSTPPCRRFQNLLQKSDATCEDGLLYLPVNVVSTSHKKPAEGLTGVIICEEKHQRESLQERLGQLGVRITYDFKSTGLDFCMVSDETSQAFKAVQQYFSPDMNIFLLNNSTLYHRKNWHQLRNPIDQHELIQLLAAIDPASAEPASYEILAIDDNAANLHLLKLQLTELGHRVTTAINGVEGVNCCQQQTFDLAFLDIQMPGMNGLEVLQTIREFTDHLPVVGLTAHVSSEERQDLMNGGMSEIVLKPMKINSLRSVLRRYIESAEIESTEIESTEIESAEIESAEIESAEIESTEAKPPIAVQRNIEEVIFDRDLALSAANDRPELADELFKLLITTLPDDQEQINLAFRNKDRQAMAESVHKLHGAIKYCGVPRLGSAVEKLETLAKVGSQDDARSALNIVNSEINSLMIWQRENSDPFGNTSTVTPGRT